MGKDKAFGIVILLIGLAMSVLYIIWGPLDLINDGATTGIWAFFDWRWAVVVPMTLAVIMIGLLAMWIGYSMITTPPPVPLEELEEELEAEEAASKAAEAETKSE
ncbi:hypothetical protein NEF87_003576 [Candidatus Lokiarchaeum ossiferum]|uniref:Transcriptional regulator n=1 Tax=Candidatus Lokiarchaeum ossiferum TaxID=2951803 RepID=A0ABY6HUV2_9ARCH|nr:hypothetical protein NEF87_003576 [Candidatus Lokiarchaeum sp. B-35]